MRRRFLAALCAVVALPALAFAATSGVPDVWILPAETEGSAPNPSICQAIARATPPPSGPLVASTDGAPAALGPYEVGIRFSGHSTYVIESAGGVRAATDYHGWLNGDERLPTIVTMNQAHSTHHTMSPDPAIPHPLYGWDPTGRNGGRAAHHITVEDMTVRNVTTDIRRFSNIPDGNSIFIFEVGGLCIGHLGHLHHMPTDAQFAEIGRLDVLMVPVDGGLTLSHQGMSDLVKRLRASIVLPMHLRSYNALPRFLEMMGGEFRLERPRAERLVVSLRNLPKEPTIVLLPNLN